ncbi:putative rRNA methyltransferase YlbH isoform X1 [Ricinus communis]|uniref:putative rRNA methyltransferase YlbH isoform X1 n=1 Tax=Ricinus communis TaxID=3988 RepID=UPI00201ACDB0|nr:putative rRNA methyltransferase YlbH isoform X1 [Ricinus communis]XP_048230701.1 putative rRNA methyltransferase YlbH isoform X1 [Ricinus communis]
MAVSVSTSPISAPLLLNINNVNSNLLYSFPFLSNVSSKSSNRISTVILCSKKSGGGLISEKKKALFERYGLNPNDFLSDSSPKSKRKKEGKNAGKGKQVVAEEAKPPRTTHRLLQVFGGKAKRKKLLSPMGMDVRPMMEVVKGCAFDILQAAGGCPASLRPGRWLDLYSGTGSVGIEAISRGCSEVHFVEMDPWVVSNVLQPNLESTGFLDVSVVHTVRVENFLERAEQFIGSNRTFDFISVTPPYMEVNYGTLMDQVSKSALVGEDTFIVVEYPLRTEMLDACGSLIKIADRRFGRTHLAIYGPKWAQKKRARKTTLSNTRSLTKFLQADNI